MAHEAGKGSKRRPTNEHAFGNNYDNIFGKHHDLCNVPSVANLAIPVVAPEPANPNAEVPDHNEPA